MFQYKYESTAAYDNLMEAYIESDSRKSQLSIPFPLNKLQS